MQVRDARWPQVARCLPGSFQRDAYKRRRCAAVESEAPARASLQWLVKLPRHGGAMLCSAQQAAAAAERNAKGEEAQGIGRPRARNPVARSLLSGSDVERNRSASLRGSCGGSVGCWASWRWRPFWAMPLPEIARDPGNGVSSPP